MFGVADRERLKDVLVATARADDRVTAAAAFGSTATGSKDRWSDIDLALGLAPGADQASVMAEWTSELYNKHGAVHHLDVASSNAVYRVFRLSSALQVDVSFWPAGTLQSGGPKFRLLFGEVASAPAPPPAEPNELIGLAWLYCLHGRSSIERGRLWQAEYMISAARHYVLALACLRNDLPTEDGMGMDDLAADVTQPLTKALVGSVEQAELRRALATTSEALIAEINHLDVRLAERIASPLRERTLPE